jgi:hypothetical protein
MVTLADVLHPSSDKLGSSRYIFRVHHCHWFQSSLLPRCSPDDDLDITLVELPSLICPFFWLVRFSLWALDCSA